MAVATCLGCAGGIAVAGSAPPRLLRADYTADFAIRPATMFFGCCGQVLIGGAGVSSRQFRSGKRGHIRWTVWTTLGATGTGLLWIDDCTPDCANGTFQSHSVSITATDVRASRYTRLVLIYRFGGHLIRESSALKRLSDTRTLAYDWV